MKKLIMVMALLGLTAAGCSKKPTAEDIGEVLKASPDIVFQLMEDNPEKFIKSAQNAARKARPQQAGPMENLEAELKNPKQPQIDESLLVGAKDAPITIVEYTDHECPFCARGAGTLSELLKMYDGKVKILIKHLPLPMHPHARLAAQYYEAVKKVSGVAKAHEWSMAIFKSQDKFRQGPADVDKFLDATAKEVKVDAKKVRGVLKDKKALAEIDAQINADTEEAQKFGFQGTPGFLINGVSLKGAYPVPMFKQVIDRVLSAQK